MICPKCGAHARYLMGDNLAEHRNPQGNLCLGLKSEQKPRKQNEVKPDAKFHYESIGDSVEHGRR